MSKTAVPVVTITLDQVLDILATPDDPFELVAEGPGVHLQFTVRLDMGEAVVDSPSTVEAVTAKQREKADPPRRDSSGNGWKGVCPECDETFTKPQALGAHRRYKHRKAQPVKAVAPKPAPPVAEAAVFPDAGPISKRPFDPDKARANAASAI